MTTDEALLAAGRRHPDRSALAEMVRDHHGFLIAMVTPLVGAESAEDVVQESWIKAFTALNGFQGRASLRTWLAQIALNTARSRRRAQTHEVAVAEWGQDPGSPIAEHFSDDGHWCSPPGRWDHNSPDELLTEEELRQCIEKHLQRLPPDQHIVLRLREFEEMGFEEIATITGLREGNVRVLLHRARQKMHAMIDHFEKLGTC